MPLSAATPRQKRCAVCISVGSGVVAIVLLIALLLGAESAEEAVLASLAVLFGREIVRWLLVKLVLGRGERP